MSHFELHICTGCADPNIERRRSGTGGGKELLKAVLAAIERRTFARSVEISDFECLGVCTRRGRASINCPGKWGIVFGGLDDRTDAEPLCDFIEAWLRGPYGQVAMKDRPKAIRNKIIGRIPPTHHHLDCEPGTRPPPNQVIKKIHLNPTSTKGD
jgi:predicted metal-binding protein